MKVGIIDVRLGVKILKFISYVLMVTLYEKTNAL